MKKFGWNLQSMNQYCNEQNEGYKVLDINLIEKSYQKQLWAFVKCPNDKHDPYWVWWNNFIHKNRCKKCYRELHDIISWTKDLVCQFYKENNFTIIDINDWKDVDTSMACYNKDGYKIIISITAIKQKNKPCIFSAYNPYSIENIKKYCKLNRADYEIVSEEYIDIKTLYQWKYVGNMLPSNEERVFELTLDGFVHGGSGHPYFSKSNGEIMFEELLKQNNIEYIREKTFKGCKDKALLQFDFYLPTTTEIVEIDGLQHTMAVDGWGGEEGLKDRIKKDKIKNKYCKTNNIKLTRIPYNHLDKESYKKLIDDKIAEILAKQEREVA